MCARGGGYLRLGLEASDVGAPGVDVRERPPDVKVPQLLLLEGREAALGGRVGSAWVGEEASGMGLK